jgi:hypothetical protein
MPIGELRLQNSIRLIRAEYEEMPGLRLTKRQVERCWTLDGSTAGLALDALLTSGFLKLTSKGAYVRDTCSA